MKEDIIKMGKHGGIIYYKVGETILSKEYTPKVENPKTLKQVQQRAKIKLLSQIGALFRPFIAIFPSSGKSSRAIFAHINYNNISTNDTTALIDYSKILLSDSTKPITQITKDIEFGPSGVRKLIGLPVEPTKDIQRVFYYLFTKADNGKLVFIDYYLSETRKSARLPFYFCWALAPFEIDEQGKSTKDYVVFAVGMGDNSEEASEYWDSIEVPEIGYLGQLIAEGIITDADFYFTETSSLAWLKGE